MSDGPPQSGKAALVSALQVRRNAKHGIAVGVLVALVVFGIFVALPDTTRPAYLYVALAFVLAASVAGLATTVLTAITAVRLARQE